MTKEELKAIDNAFKYFDYDCSGQISTGELKTLVRSLGQNPTDIEVREMMKEIDPTENGSFNKQQFIDLMASGWLKDFTTVINYFLYLCNFFLN